ncbi:MAG: hypothetical protein ACAI25_16745 [Planctomycetota bacterium]
MVLAASLGEIGVKDRSNTKPGWSLWVCTALALLVCCLWAKAEFMNAEAAYFLPGERPPGNAKWRIAHGETEEEWKRFNEPRDADGKFVERPYTQAELERMKSDIVHIRALNALNRYVRSILVVVYLVPPIVFVWALAIASRQLPFGYRILALLLAVSVLACELVVQYRLQNVELIG